MESNPTYKWTFEGQGGTYAIYDPNETVVNPLPPYSYANNESELPLSTDMVEGTVEALTFLFADKDDYREKTGQYELNIHKHAVLNSAMQLLYALPPGDDTEAPTLANLLDVLQNETSAQNDEERKAEKQISAKLESFLSSTGRVFEKQTNFDFI